MTAITTTNQKFDAFDLERDGNSEERTPRTLDGSECASFQSNPARTPPPDSKSARGTITDGERMTLHFSDFDLLADELAGYGPEVLAESPPELRETQC